MIHPLQLLPTLKRALHTQSFHVLQQLLMLFLGLLLQLLLPGLKSFGWLS